MKNLLTAALVVAFAGFVIAAELESGLKVGEAPGAYQVKDITGPSAGKSLCYRCQYGARPVVNVFTRTVNDQLAKTIKELDGIVAKNEDKQMRAFVVVLAEDAEKIAPQLEKLAKDNGIKNVPLTIFEGESGPPEYNISKDADVTVLMWNKQSVKTNIVLAKGKLDESATKKIVAEAAKIAE
jgi:hypothetical protein